MTTDRSLHLLTAWAVYHRQRNRREIHWEDQTLTASLCPGASPSDCMSRLSQTEKQTRDSLRRPNTYCISLSRCFTFWLHEPFITDRETDERFTEKTKHLLHLSVQVLHLLTAWAVYHRQRNRREIHWEDQTLTASLCPGASPSDCMSRLSQTEKQTRDSLRRPNTYCISLSRCFTFWPHEPFITDRETDERFTEKTKHLLHLSVQVLHLLTAWAVYHRQRNRREIHGEDQTLTASLCPGASPSDCMSRLSQTEKQTRDSLRRPNTYCISLSRCFTFWLHEPFITDRETDERFTEKTKHLLHLSVQVPSPSDCMSRLSQTEKQTRDSRRRPNTYCISLSRCFTFWPHEPFITDRETDERFTEKTKHLLHLSVQVLHLLTAWAVYHRQRNRRENHGEDQTLTASLCPGASPSDCMSRLSQTEKQTRDSLRRPNTYCISLSRCFTFWLHEPFITDRETDERITEKTKHLLHLSVQVPSPSDCMSRLSQTEKQTRDSRRRPNTYCISLSRCFTFWLHEPFITDRETDERFTEKTKHLLHLSVQVLHLLTAWAVYHRQRNRREIHWEDQTLTASLCPGASPSDCMSRLSQTEKQTRDSRRRPNTYCISLSRCFTFWPHEPFITDRETDERFTEKTKHLLHLSVQVLHLLTAWAVYHRQRNRREIHWEDQTLTASLCPGPFTFWLHEPFITDRETDERFTEKTKHLLHLSVQVLHLLTAWAVYHRQRNRREIHGEDQTLTASLCPGASPSDCMSRLSQTEKQTRDSLRRPNTYCISLSRCSTFWLHEPFITDRETDERFTEKTKHLLHLSVQVLHLLTAWAVYHRQRNRREIHWEDQTLTASLCPGASPSDCMSRLSQTEKQTRDSRRRPNTYCISLSRCFTFWLHEPFITDRETDERFTEKTKHLLHLSVQVLHLLTAWAVYHRQRNRREIHWEDQTLTASLCPGASPSDCMSRLSQTEKQTRDSLRRPNTYCISLSRCFTFWLHEPFITDRETDERFTEKTKHLLHLSVQVLHLLTAWAVYQTEKQTRDSRRRPNTYCISLSRCFTFWLHEPFITDRETDERFTEKTKHLLHLSVQVLHLLTAWAVYHRQRNRREIHWEDQTLTTSLCPGASPSDCMSRLSQTEKQTRDSLRRPNTYCISLSRCFTFWLHEPFITDRETDERFTEKTKHLLHLSVQVLHLLTAWAVYHRQRNRRETHWEDQTLTASLCPGASPSDCMSRLSQTEKQTRDSRRRPNTYCISLSRCFTFWLHEPFITDRETDERLTEKTKHLLHLSVQVLHLLTAWAVYHRQRNRRETHWEDQTLTASLCPGASPSDRMSRLSQTEKQTRDSRRRPNTYCISLSRCFTFWLHEPFITDRETDERLTEKTKHLLHLSVQVLHLLTAWAVYHRQRNRREIHWEDQTLTASLCPRFSQKIHSLNSIKVWKLGQNLWTFFSIPVLAQFSILSVQNYIFIII